MLQVLLSFTLLAGKCYMYFYISLGLRLASKCYRYFFMFQFAYSYFYTVIFMFHLPYMDVELFQNELLILWTDKDIYNLSKQCYAGRYY